MGRGLARHRQRRGPRRERRLSWMSFFPPFWLCTTHVEFTSMSSFDYCNDLAYNLFSTY